MLRQEKFGAGMADQKDLDAQFARAIMGDGKFQVKVQLFIILPIELDCFQSTERPRLYR